MKTCKNQQRFTMKHHFAWWISTKNPIQKPLVLAKKCGISQWCPSCGYPSCVMANPAFIPKQKKLVTTRNIYFSKPFYQHLYSQAILLTLISFHISPGWEISQPYLMASLAPGEDQVNRGSVQSHGRPWLDARGYPLVNIQKAIENGHL